jgi:hypothetical protein
MLYYNLLVSLNLGWEGKKNIGGPQAHPLKSCTCSRGGRGGHGSGVFFVWSLFCDFFYLLVKMFMTILSLANRGPTDRQIH